MSVVTRSPTPKKATATAHRATAVFDGPRYVLVSDSDYQREIVAYRGLRYSEQGFETLGTGDGVDRVLSNGGFRVYHVDE